MLRRSTLGFTAPFDTHRLRLNSTMASALRRRYPFMQPDQVVDNLVIGAGVVGMAICRQLATSIQGSTFLVERCLSFGHMTASTRYDNS